MRFAAAVIAAFTALAGFSPAAHAECAVLSIESPRSMLHFAPQRCAWSAEGLPTANEQWRPLLVFGGFGGAENRFLLRDGVLLAADGQSQIAPAPGPPSRSPGQPIAFVPAVRGCALFSSRARSRAW